MELYAEISATELRWYSCLRFLFKRGIFLRYIQNYNTSIVEIVEIGQIAEKCFTNDVSFYIIVLKF